MMFALDHNQKTVAKLKVIGIGGAGGNAVNRMIQSGLQGVEYIVLNTDAMALERNQAELKLQIGSKLTQGLGAGADPQVGMRSMQEDLDRLRDHLEGADMVFIAAGMGGGTGTGGAPVVAQLARSMGILTVAVVTKPFQWEGKPREKKAHAGLEALREAADTVIVVPNQKLLSVVEKGTPLRQAFTIADEVLSSATRGISEIILGYGEIQVDFADVRAIMSHGGDALMGTGRASGENRATIAMDRAIHSPLLENVNIAGATGVVVNFSGGEDMSLTEIDEAMNSLYAAVGGEGEANIIFGTVINPEIKDEIAVTVIATGFGTKHPVRPATDSGAVQAPAQHVPFRPAPGARPAEALPAADAGRSLMPRAPERVTRIERVERVERVEDVSGTGKVPFGAPRQPEEARQSAHETAAAANRGNNLLNGLFGGKADIEPDIDYETPAFLRNQAD